MGANQSSGTDSQSGADGPGQRQAQKTCYYKVLEIDVKASEDEIKKAYRRKALELHPDRNYGNVEAATKQFAEVQAAYEVLSDPQERAWYDSHKDAILRDDDGADYEQRPSQITTTEDILRMLSKFHGQIDYSDKPTGFFGALRDLFDKLAQEEAAFSESELPSDRYPDFGHADDDYEDKVRKFYAQWTGFATCKHFSWRDVCRYSEAPDRRVRRLMEKENKRLRDDAIREFNETVRSLVAFVKKRDPRYKPSTQSEAERQKALKDAATAQAARSRAANQAKDSTPQQAVPEWSKSNAADESEFAEGDWDSEDEAPKEEFECVVCNKSFKSEKQFEAHERSKKHIKEVQQLKRQMKRENRDLDLDNDLNLSDQKELDIPESSTEDREADTQSPALERSRSISLESAAEGQDPIEEAESKDSSSDDDYATRDEIQNRILNDEQPDSEISSKFASQSLSDGEEASNNRPKKGKAKEKRAKKAAKKDSVAAGSSSEFKCTACQSAFPSRTKLFAHIKELKHDPKSVSSVKGAKGKKK